jgi:hypothetical protein
MQCFSAINGMSNIISEEEFCRRKEQEGCLIFISDKFNGNKLHRAQCSFVTLENFREKVIENHSQNGDYFYVGEDVDFALLAQQGDDCQFCKPERLNFFKTNFGSDQS